MSTTAPSGVVIRDSSKGFEKEYSAIEHSAPQRSANENMRAFHQTSMPPCAVIIVAVHPPRYIPPMPPHKDQDFMEFILDQLSALKSVTSRRMFGGIGLYRADTFFAIIDEGRLYFVTDETTRTAYTECGMRPFQYAPGKFIHTYYEVPVDVLEDDRALADWARTAVDAQTRRKQKPARSRTKSRALTSKPRQTKARRAKARTTARKRS